MIFHSIGDRLRVERERLKVSQATLAERGGVKPLTQHSYEKGSSYPNADYLAKVVGCGVDVLYVVTGKRSQPPKAASGASNEVLLMLQSRGIFPDGQGGGSVTLAGLALLLDYIREAKGTRPVTLTEKVLTKVAKFAPSDARPWRLQPVALVPREGGPKSHTLLVYRVKTPVSLAWQLGPFSGQIPPRIELTGWPDFPIKVRADEEEVEERWQLDLSSDGSFKVLDAGKALSAELVTADEAQREASLGMAGVSTRTASIHIGGDVGQTIAGDQTNTGPVSFSVGGKRRKEGA